ncbi:hypothetical protein ASG87_01495 [Frateuria sp. Soil773]|uniref:type IV secretion system DNA-binding domain-containing protein n=1 Tax=Frateuria sp. Soil773 TaxID=1736407 RepID=UPI0006F23766|nr:type IV secretion system DNA-binding domain-containing protein [Frateuria sp. Soil773]KRE90838.1 hypothetical protein ASG87_01495 [Frateuria sp. Soil773]
MSLDVIKMGCWLGISEQIARAKTEALNLATRWDVPQGQRKPDQDPADKELYIEAKKGVWAVLAHDMRDIKGRFYRTKPDPITGQQGRVAGHMLQEDLVLGAFPASIPLLFGLLSLLGVLNVLVAHTWVTLPISAAILALGVLIATATEKFTWGCVAVFLAGVLPALGYTMAAVRVMQMINSGGRIPLIIGGVVVALAVLYGGLRGARIMVGSLVGLMVVLLIAAHVPAILKPVVLALPGALLPAFWAISEDLRRAKRLAVQGRHSFEFSSLPLKHIEGRAAQAKRASLDASPLIVYGTAQGEFTGRGDAWAPDAGLPMQQSVNDIATHLLVLGSTGRGKTSSIIRPVVVAWIKSKVGGTLIMDGKGSLALEFAGLKNYLLVDPSIPGCIVGLYEGMTPSDVSRTLSQIFISDSTKGDSRMWADLGYDMCRHSAVVLRALVDMQEAEETPAERCQWHWTLHNHLHVAVMGLAGADALADEPSKFEDQAAAADADKFARKDSKQTLQVFLDYLKANHPKGEEGLLAEARHYFLSQLPAQPANVRGSIFTTFSSWLTVVLGSEELLGWAQAEHGVKVEDCLHGRHVGINLPETRFGRSGSVATAFLKNRVFNEVRRRADGDWRKADPTAKPLLCVIDECQILLSDAEMEISSISRQLGCYFVCCSQTIESIRQTSTNTNKTEAFLDSFQSFIVLKTSFQTIEWVSQRIGTTWQFGSTDGSIGIDFAAGAIKCLESPLFEQAHPLRRWMQTLLRRGAGGFRDVGGIPLDRTIEHDLGFNPCIIGGSWEEKPLLYRADFATLTSMQGVALVQVMRAGSPRRDFIYLDKVMDEMPAELMDPDYVPAQKKSAVNLSKEEEAIAA